MTYVELDKITVGQSISQTFYISDVASRLTKAKKPFTILTVRDNTGMAEIKIWGFDSEKNSELVAGTFAQITCNVKEYNGKPDLSTETPPMIVPQPKDISVYVDSRGLADDEIEEHWGYLEGVMGQVEDPYLKAYLKIMFDPESMILEKFRNGAASVTNRESFRGGLINHVAKVMHNALHLVDVQVQSTKYGTKNINRDLIICGVMAHDVGKAFTYNVDSFETKTTRVDQLIGHLALSYAISVQTWIAVESYLHKAVPEELKDHLNHIILSHHGALEYGSPIPPKTVEAEIVHISDIMDSQTTNYTEQANENKVDDLGFVSGNFITRKIYVGINDK